VDTFMNVLTATLVVASILCWILITPASVRVNPGK
jgi:hypothetical protein